MDSTTDTNNMHLNNASPELRSHLVRMCPIDLDKYKKTTPCFFTDRELTEGKAASRHCTIYKKGYFDYIVKKEFKTFEDWIADCGTTLPHVMYGYSKFDGCQSYVPLQQILDVISPQQPDIQQLIDLMNKLQSDDLDLNALIIKKPIFIAYSDYMSS